MSAQHSIGFIGTGIMGLHMARRLAQAGYGVTAWNRTPSKAEPLKEYGVDMPRWGTASAPLVDGKRVIALVGGKDGALVVCFDVSTGGEVWRSLEGPEVGYCPPVIFTFGEVRQLIIWHPAAVSSMPCLFSLMVSCRIVGADNAHRRQRGSGLRP